MISKEKDFQEFFPVWNKLTAGQQEQLEHAVRYEHAKKGTIIHNGSLDCVGVLLIHSGQLRAYMISEEGREITLFRSATLFANALAHGKRVNFCPFYNGEPLKRAKRGGKRR